VATNFDMEKLQLRPTRLHRTHSAKVDTRLSKADIGEMEAKIATLNAHMEHVRADLGRLADVPERLGRVEVQVNNLPTKDYLSGKLGDLLRNTVLSIGLIVSIAGVAVTAAVKLL